MEAVNTNIVGADNVTRAADQLKQKSVFYYTDRRLSYQCNGFIQVYNGKIMIAKSRNSKTIFCATRGNVMGTRGSVIPLFVEQIQKRQMLL